MTRIVLDRLINALIKLRDRATDETALDATGAYPTWREGVNYTTGERVRHNGVLYKVLQPHTSQAAWTPDTAPSLFAKVLNDTIREWEQPNSTNTYSKGDKVRHNGKVWVSDYDNNSWEPGVFGWTEVIDG